MKKTEKTVVMDLTENPKNAALYFDGVIPLGWEFIEKVENQGIIKKILPNSISEDTQVIKKFEDFSKRSAAFGIFLHSLNDGEHYKFNIDGVSDGKKILEMFDTYCGSILNDYEKVNPLTLGIAYLKLFALMVKCLPGGGSKSFVLPETPFSFKEKVLGLMDNKKFKELLKEESGKETESFVEQYSKLKKNFFNLNQEYDAISLKLFHLDLIDTSKASWEQIVEIRKDKSSINKLRKLKAFFQINYSGKEKNFIEDDLLNRIEEYNNTVKDWNFETITSTFSLLLTSKTLFPTVASSLALSLFGGPLEAVVASTAGATVELGKVSLHLSQQRRKIFEFHRDHPLAYIIDAKKKLEKE